MIKANELRIGNYVHSVNHKEDFRINLVDANRLYDHISPIPLTEEWLIKCGFEKHVLSYHKLNCVFYIKPVLGGDLKASFYYAKAIEGVTLSTVRYVHQLQNLYFALTGEELVINIHS